MSWIGKIATKVSKFSLNESDKRLYNAITRIIGTSPTNLSIYKLAMQHTSVAKENKDGFKESNERLEYLGDAVLGSIVAHFLFKRYPYKNEGFLTDIRSRIVSRASLGELSKKMGLDELIEVDNKRKNAYSHKSLYGDAIEAFIGAVYLDKGFGFCQKFIINRILLTHLDLQIIIETDKNYKSKLIEWAQKESRNVQFSISKDKAENNSRQFVAQVLLDDNPISTGNGYTKKNAQQDAARRACEALEIE
jgi:ribonuclease-3